MRLQFFKRYTAEKSRPIPPCHSCRSRTIYPAELQPHILGPAVLREQQILYHDLRRIARCGGIFFADPVLRGRLPAMRIHGGAGAGVRRSAGKIPAVWSGSSALRPCGLAIRRCGQAVCRSEPGGHAVGRRPWRPFRLGGATRRLFGPAVLPCGQAVCRSEPGGHAVGRRPRRPFRLGAAWRLFGPAVLPCGQTFVGVNPADTPSADAPGGRSVWGAARRLFGPAVPPCGHGWQFCPAAGRLSA